MKCWFRLPFVHHLQLFVPFRCHSKLLKPNSDWVSISLKAAEGRNNISLKLPCRRTESEKKTKHCNSAKCGNTDQSTCCYFSWYLPSNQFYCGTSSWCRKIQDLQPKCRWFWIGKDDQLNKKLPGIQRNLTSTNRHAFGEKDVENCNVYIQIFASYSLSLCYVRNMFFIYILGTWTGFNKLRNYSQTKIVTTVCF